MFRQVELARSLSDERLLLSNEQIESGIDAEIFSALSMVVRGSLFDMEIGTAAWHATSQGWWKGEGWHKCTVQTVKVPKGKKK